MAQYFRGLKIKKKVLGKVKLENLEQSQFTIIKTNIKMIFINFPKNWITKISSYNNSSCLYFKILPLTNASFFPLYKSYVAIPLVDNKLLYSRHEVDSPSMMHYFLHEAMKSLCFFHTEDNLLNYLLPWNLSMSVYCYTCISNSS